MSLWGSVKKYTNKATDYIPQTRAVKEGVKLYNDTKRKGSGTAEDKAEADRPDEYYTNYGGSAEAQKAEMQQWQKTGSEYANKSNQQAIQTRDQQNAALGQAQNQSNTLYQFSQGRGPMTSASAEMLKRASDENASQALGMAASGRGTASGATLQKAMAAGVQANQRAASEAAQMRSQEQMSALNASMNAEQNIAQGYGESGKTYGALSNQAFGQQTAGMQGAEQLEVNRQKLASDLYNQAQNRRYQLWMAEDQARAQTTSATITAAGNLASKASGKPSS
jgi:hypothetical protein